MIIHIIIIHKITILEENEFDGGAYGNGPGRGPPGRGGPNIMQDPDGGLPIHMPTKHPRLGRYEHKIPSV